MHNEFCLAEAWEGVGMEACGGDMQEMRLGKWKRDQAIKGF